MSTTPATTTRRSRSPSRRSAPAVAAAVEHAMSEAQLQDAVVELARLCGFLVYHTWRSDHSPAGFPDLVLAHCDPRQARVLWVECKSARGRLSPAQQQWRDVLTSAGCEWHCWRPQDWRDGAVERTLVLMAGSNADTSGETFRVSGEVRKAVRSKESGLR